MNLTNDEARHFLRRVGFGIGPGEVAHFAGRTHDDVVNEVVSRIPNAPAAPDIDLRGRQWPAMEETIRLWILRMRDARWTANPSDNEPSPLVERLTLFWHGHFCSAQQKVDDMEAMWEQNQLFRREALGDFETLCQEVSVGGAMLRYLDNEVNVAGSEQENFAREVMELFTMGVGNYGEDDVVAMAKAWTGHNNIGWLRDEQRYDSTYQFYPEHHDDSNKTLFGIHRRWDGPETLTEIVRGSKQDATARFIARKLWLFFVGPEPTAAELNTIAAAFVTADMNIRELMRAILTHATFWAESTRYTIVKSPTDFVVSYLKQVPVDYDDLSVPWRMGHMGQRLFNPPNVAGWGLNGYWMSAATMWGRAGFVEGGRWNMVSDGFLDELDDLAPDAAATRLFEVFDLSDVSATTRAQVKLWFEKTNLDWQMWSRPPSGMLIAAMTPEFQVI